MTDIKPALTPSQWLSLNHFGVDKALCYGVDWSGRRLSRHALAALALYGEPEGFTREDVEMMRTLHAKLDGFETGWLYNEGKPYEERLASIIARIAALLPENDKNV